MTRNGSIWMLTAALALSGLATPARAQQVSDVRLRELIKLATERSAGGIVLPQQAAVPGDTRQIVPLTLDEAVKLEPKNPRVRLVEALVAYDRAGKDAVEKAAAVQKLRTVTPMFEAARAGASTTPEWGAAESYAFLGRALFDARDVVGAREALERALLIAPDYALAKRLMSQITR